ncbi:MAG: hypothetical protein ACTHKL_19635 [Streptosporangiaceae bacterium]
MIRALPADHNTVKTIYTTWWDVTAVPVVRATTSLTAARSYRPFH